MDLWPYVNGKALMSGLNLKRMEASDMLDVIHFIYEEDLHHTSEESVASQSGARVSLYREFYGREYKYPYKKQTTRNTSPNLQDYDPASDSDLGVMDEAESVKPFSPAEVDPSKERKPTMGADTITQFDADAALPFGDILDAPAG